MISESVLYCTAAGTLGDFDCTDSNFWGIVGTSDLNINLKQKLISEGKLKGSLDVHKGN